MRGSQPAPLGLRQEMGGERWKFSPWAGASPYCARLNFPCPGLALPGLAAPVRTLPALSPAWQAGLTAISVSLCPASMVTFPPPQGGDPVLGSLVRLPSVALFALGSQRLCPPRAILPPAWVGPWRLN